MKCSNCGKEVPEKAKVCGYCGKKLEKPERPICPNCGKELPAKAKACGYCGTPLELKKAAAVRPELAKKAPVEKPPAKKAEVKTGKLPKWVIPAGLGVAALTLVVFFVMKPSSKPETVKDEPQQESAQQVEEAPAVTEMGLLAGTWRGEVENKLDDGGTFEVTFVFPEDCELNSYCGRIMIPEFSLVSDVMITSVSGYEYEFSLEVNEDKPEDELPFEYLKFINANQLKFFSISDDWDEQGTLYKQ